MRRGMRCGTWAPTACAASPTSTTSTSWLLRTWLTASHRYDLRTLSAPATGSLTDSRQPCSKAAAWINDRKWGERCWLRCGPALQDDLRIGRVHAIATSIGVPCEQVAPRDPPHHLVGAGHDAREGGPCALPI